MLISFFFGFVRTIIVPSIIHDTWLWSLVRDNIICYVRLVVYKRRFNNYIYYFLLPASFEKYLHILSMVCSVKIVSP